MEINWKIYLNEQAQLAAQEQFILTGRCYYISTESNHVWMHGLLAAQVASDLSGGAAGAAGASTSTLSAPAARAGRAVGSCHATGGPAPATIACRTSVHAWRPELLLQTVWLPAACRGQWATRQ